MVFLDPHLWIIAGSNPIHVATSHDNGEAIALLLFHGASTSTQTPDNRRTPLHLAAQHALPAATRLLLSAGADPDACDAGGLTPLHLAADRRRDSAETVQVLLDAGADANAHDARGRTALWHAA